MKARDLYKDTDIGNHDDLRSNVQKSSKSLASTIAEGSLTVYCELGTTLYQKLLQIWCDCVLINWLEVKNIIN